MSRSDLQRFENTFASSRLLVRRSIEEEFTSRLIEFAAKARMGDLKKFETQVGPVTTQQQHRRVDKQHSESIQNVGKASGRYRLG